MAGKRKFDSDDDTNAPASAKQLKLVPFPSYNNNNASDDVEMSDDSSPFNGLYSRTTNISTMSSASSSGSAPSSPSLFMAEPLPRSESFSAGAKPIGLVGCGVLGDSFKHQSQNCTQLPKLRMACASGNGRGRTMWSHCEQCGAIAMVDLD